MPPVDVERFFSPLRRRPLAATMGRRRAGDQWIVWFLSWSESPATGIFRRRRTAGRGRCLGLRRSALGASRPAGGADVGAGRGPDRLAARVALKGGMRLVVPLPFPVGDYQRDFAEDSRREFRVICWPRPARRSWSPTVARAGRARTAICGSASGSSSTRTILPALWDGEHRDDVGGTSHLVRMMLEGNKPVIHLATPHRRKPEVEGAFLVRRLPLL